MTEGLTDPRERVLDAALKHVPFDGWSAASLRAAARNVGISEDAALALFPRGGVDMALAFHRRGDAALVARLQAASLEGMRFRDKVATAVRWRIEAIEDREAVRRGTALFALPQHAADGARALWETADHIWVALGDSSDDVNWYTKRATLAAVYGSVVLFWLGDYSPAQEETTGFIDRRIADVMQIEAVKARLRETPVLRGVLAAPNALLSKIRAPRRVARDDLPGRWSRPRQN